VFKGKKVILRPMREEDIERQHEFNQDPELFLLNASPPRPSPRKRAEGIYEICTRHKKGTYYFAIEADGKYIGNCSLKQASASSDAYRLGILIGDREYWNKGYGRDTVQVLLHFGFHHHGARRIELDTNSRNKRAIRCFEACGFKEEGRLRQAVWLDGRYFDTVLMGMLRGEWESDTQSRTE